MIDTMVQPASLGTLPSEIILHIFEYLSPQSLAQVSSTSHALRGYSHDDKLWEKVIHSNTLYQAKPLTPFPSKTWRELYISHHPFWFLPRHAVWISDSPNVGGLYLAQYRAREGSLVARTVLARNVSPSLAPWAYDPSTYIHEFQPEVSLWESDPDINLTFKEDDFAYKLQKEVKMDSGRRGYNSSLALCLRMPPEREHHTMSLWPPATIPSLHRVRNESHTKFTSDAQRPSSLARMSDRACRIRKWPEWPAGAQWPQTNIEGLISTWSTLLKETYTPDRHKPWQGIWVGDYAVHGCEFLLVMHKEGGPDPGRKVSEKPSTGSGLPSGRTFTFGDDETGQTGSPLRRSSKAMLATSGSQDEYFPSGGLEAIKLTGDVNIPRGQCTWFADDIGPNGLVRVASDSTFEGARIVKSMGHVANRGFSNDRYIPSQLIMIDHDSLAQYWEVRRDLGCNRLIPYTDNLISHSDTSHSIEE